MRIQNKKATHDYEIVDHLEAGLALTGPEVKSLRGGHAKLEGSFVRIIGSEAYLVGGEIYPYINTHPEGYDSKRTRKLLLHKRQLISLKSKMDGQHLTLVPLTLYTKGSHFKLDIGLARGKKQYEKRDKLRRETQKRELGREFRGKVK